MFSSSITLETTYDFSKSQDAKDAKAKTVLSIIAQSGKSHKSMIDFRLYLDVSLFVEQYSLSI